MQLFHLHDVFTFYNILSQNMAIIHYNLVVSLPGKTLVACEFFRYKKYSKFRQTGSEHAADSKLSYTIQFSILKLCAIYQEAGLCGS